jgi:site-specific DNA recombinase
MNNNNPFAPVKKKRVALYLRVSTEDQCKEDRYGMRVQEDRLKKYCESQEYEMSDELIYKDEGKSGSLAIEKRDSLKQLFDDAKLKKFDIVIVYRLDRFFRSTGKLLGAVERLLECGVDFKSATESFDTETPNGRLVLQMLGALAEHEREVIRERMSGGREQAARTGKWVTGVPPYGYRVDKPTKKLIIVPEEAEVVKKFYHWLVYEKCSMTEITRRANELNLPSPKHQPTKKRKIQNFWWKRTLNRILVNEVYTGEFYYRKYKRPFKYLDGVLDEENQRPKKEWISISVPQIIEKSLFQSAIKQLTKNRQDSERNTKRPYLYANLLHCGYSGNKLQSGFQKPTVHKNSKTLGKYYHTYVSEKRK